MSELHIALLYAFIAGATIPLGGRWRASKVFCPIGWRTNYVIV